MTDADTLDDRAGDEDVAPSAEAVESASQVLGRRASLTRAASRGWQVVGVMLAIILVGWLVLQVALVVAAIVLAILIASAVAPATDRLTARGWSRNVAALTVTVGWILVLIGVFVLVGWRMIEQVPELADQLGLALERLRAEYPSLPLEGESLMNLMGGAEGEEGAQNPAVGGAISGARALSGFLLAVVLSFFFVRDGGRMWRSCVVLFASPGRERVDAMGRAAYATVSEYVHGLVVIATADAVLSAIGLFALGIPLASALVVLTFFAAFVPAVGAFVVGGLAVAFAFAAGGLKLAVIVAVLYTVIQQVDSSLLQPHVMGQRLPLHPAAVLVALTIGGLLGGVIGALLAVPIGAAMVAAAKEYLTFGLATDVFADA